MDSLDQLVRPDPVAEVGPLAVLRVGGVRPTFALAPMEGVTGPLVRELFAELGGIDYCVTEFIRVSREVPSAKVFFRECPELHHQALTLGHTPVHVQLLGGDPERMAEAARRVVALGATHIDLNFGCPAPSVNNSDGGATLLRTPCRVEEVTRAVRDAVPSALAVSAKVRLGWDDPDAIGDIARAAEQGGASWLTIHGRTKAQGYAPPADWVRIGRAARIVRIPVVANGDLNAPADIVRCHEVTGCTRFMLGRGAIGRPELFRVLRGVDSAFWPIAKRVALLERFFEESLRRFPEPDQRKGVIGHCKQWGRAMGLADGAMAPVFEALKRKCTVEEVRAVLSATRTDHSAQAACAA